MPAVVFARASLGPYQIALPNGTVVGYGSGSNIQYSSITGLRDLPEIRSSDAPKGQIDGIYPGMNNLGLRSVQIKWDTTAAFFGVESALTTLAAGLQSIRDPSTVVMTVGDFLRQQAGIGTSKPVSALQLQLPGRTYPILLFGRPVKHGVPMDLNYQFNQAKPTTQFDCADGAIYDFNVVSGSCGLPSPSSGHVWGTAWPWSWGNSSGGSFQLNNTGLYQATPFFVVQGPCSNPTILNQSTGQYITLGVTLGPSDVLGVDCQAGVVTLNGTANRNNTVQVGSTFFTLPPGTSTIGFSSTDSTQVAGTVTGYILPTSSTI